MWVSRNFGNTHRGQGRKAGGELNLAAEAIPGSPVWKEHFMWRLRKVPNWVGCNRKTVELFRGAVLVGGDDRLGEGQCSWDMVKVLSATYVHLELASRVSPRICHNKYNFITL